MFNALILEIADLYNHTKSTMLSVCLSSETHTMGLLPVKQICELCMRQEYRNVFPASTVKRSQHASRHVRDARVLMHAGIANWQLPLESVAGKRSRHSRRMRNPQVCVSGKKAISEQIWHVVIIIMIHKDRLMCVIVLSIDDISAGKL